MRHPSEMTLAMLKAKRRMQQDKIDECCAIIDAQQRKLWRAKEWELAYRMEIDRRERMVT